MSVVKRVAVAIGQVAWSAAACAIIAIAIYARDGEAIVRDGGMSLGSLLMIYAATAIASGVVLGLLRPIAKENLGITLVSIPVAWPAAFTIMLFSRDGRLGEMDAVDYGVSIALAVVFGPLTAAYIQIRQRQRDDAGRSPK